MGITQKELATDSVKLALTLNDRIQAAAQMISELKKPTTQQIADVIQECMLNDLKLTVKKNENESN